MYTTRQKTRVEIDEIVRVEKGIIKPNSNYEWHKVSLVIPREPCPNIDTSKIFGIRYYIEVSLFLRG